MDNFQNNKGAAMSDIHPKANPRHRLAGVVLDAVLLMVTFYIGWIIWTLILWGRGQTPAKLILKMRVMDVKSHQPATWGQMAIRQFLIPFVPGALIGVAYGSWAIRHGSVLGEVAPAGAFLVVLALLYILTLAYSLTDSFWILGKEKRRLVDYFASTYVVNEAVTLHTSSETPTFTTP